MTENPLFPPEMNAAQYPKNEFVIGDLGGVPVRIPHYFAEYVEYDGDPGFGEKRKVPAPERTYQSKLASFGFNVRFPDMAGISSIELWKDYNKYHDVYWKDYYDPVKSLSPWIDVGVTSGAHYYGDGFLDRYISSTLRFDAAKKGHPELAYDNFERLAKSEFGLTVYAPPEIDLKTKQPYRMHDRAHDLFVHRNTVGAVDTYIECSNRNIPNWKFTSCTQ